LILYITVSFEHFSFYAPGDIASTNVASFHKIFVYSQIIKIKLVETGKYRM